LSALDEAPVHSRQALEVRSDLLDLGGAGAKSRKVERKLERRPVADAADELLGVVLAEETRP
jgi:hypothetical protein